MIVTPKENLKRDLQARIVHSQAKYGGMDWIIEAVIELLCELHIKFDAVVEKVRQEMSR